MNVYGSVNFASLGDDPLGEILSFSRCQEPAQLNAALLDAVQVDVQAIEQLLQDADAFDVIELMRLREIPVAPVAGLDAGFDGSGAIVEILALILLARPSRKPDPRPRSETRPHEAVPELHRRAARLLRLATFKLLAEAALRTDQPLARLAAEYQSHVVSVRSMQSPVSMTASMPRSSTTIGSVVRCAPSSDSPTRSSTLFELRCRTSTARS